MLFHRYYNADLPQHPQRTHPHYWHTDAVTKTLPLCRSRHTITIRLSSCSYLAGPGESRVVEHDIDENESHGGGGHHHLTGQPAVQTHRVHHVHSDVKQGAWNGVTGSRASQGTEVMFIITDSLFVVFSFYFLAQYLCLLFV